MKKAKTDYETPELKEADFGKFVKGASAPGQANPDDQGSDDIP